MKLNVKISYYIKWSLALFMLISLVFTTACKKEKNKIEVTTKFDLTQVIDSSAFGDVKFGITKNDFLKQLKIPLVENKMAEPDFDYSVTEVERIVNIEQQAFSGYYYFDAQDSLYQIRLMKHCMNDSSQGDYLAACEAISGSLKSKYGKGTSLKAMEGHTRLYWGLKNKKIELEYFCFERDCIIECSIIELNLFEKNKNRRAKKLHLPRIGAASFLKKQDK